MAFPSRTGSPDAMRQLQERFDLEHLDSEPASVVVIGLDGTILWVNAAWRDLGAANQARPETILPGASYVEAILGIVRSWFVLRADHCLHSGQPLEHDYECSSWSQKRLFHMRMLPLASVGLLMTHSLRLEVPHDRPCHLPDLAMYQGEGGLITACSNCRRVRRADRSAWDWVPAWVKDPPPVVSHGLCVVCFEFYWHDA